MMPSVEIIKDVTVVKVNLEQLDAGNSEDFRRDMAPTLQDCHKLVLDLTGVQFADSRGCGAILSVPEASRLGWRRFEDLQCFAPGPHGIRVDSLASAVRNPRHSGTSRTGFSNRDAGQVIGIEFGQSPRWVQLPLDLDFAAGWRSNQWLFFVFWRTIRNTP